MIYLHQIDPVAFSFGAFKVHWYGLMYLLGFLCAWYLGKKRLARARSPISLRAFEDLAFYVMLGVIIGGRVGYMLIYGWHEWTRDPLSLLRVWEGGMSFHGGLLGVLLGMAWWSRRNAINFWDTVDFVAPLIPPGLGFGRLGNFIGGELFGKLTHASWGVVFPHALPEPWASLPREGLLQAYRSGQLDAFARHPSQLYQAALEGLVLFLALWWFTRTPRPRYATAGLFALLYGVFRFAVEWVRVPDVQMGYLAWGWLTTGQLLSLPLVAIGLWLLLASRRQATTAGHVAT